MNRDTFILIAAWILTTIMLIITVPRNRIREAQVVFLFKQLLTWITGLLVVEMGLIEYPVEFFKHAAKSSFTFEYYVYPAVCVAFNLHYPRGQKLSRQFSYYFGFCSALTGIEAALEKYTNVIHYIHWTWYTTWITLLVTFYISRKYYTWFFKLQNTDAAE